MSEEKIKKTENLNLSKDIDAHDDPLLDCLILLAKLNNIPVSRLSLCSGLPLVDNKLSAELFPRAANRAGLSSRLLHRPLENVSNLELPAIVLLETGGAIVLVKVDEENNLYKILLPESGLGEKEITHKELKEVYSGYAIFVRPKYKPDSLNDNENEPDSENWFWGTLGSSWRIYRDVLLASFLINLFGLTTPFFILNVYDRVVPNNAYETLWVLAIGISIIYLFELLMRSLRGYFIDLAGKKADLVISGKIFEKVLGLRLEVRPKSVGAFTKNLQEFESIRDFITSFSVVSIVDMPFVLLGIAALWFIAAPMVWIPLIAIPMLLLFTLMTQVPIKKAVKNSFSASAKKNAIIVESMSGIETIKTLGAESQIQRSLEEAVAYTSKWGAYARIFSSSVNNVAMYIQNMSVVAVVILGVYLIAEGELSQGGLIACIILSRRTIAPMSQVANLAARYHRAKAALDSLNNIMSLPVERPGGIHFLHRSRFKGEVALHDVTFSYPAQINKALKKISIKVSPGEKVAIIGPTGSGKTTIGKLVLGLYASSDGMVSIDGTDIRQIDPADLRNYVGYVPQDVILFTGSVKDNITFGTHDIEDDVILRAAEFSGVSRFVKNHPMGFDMQVGEQGRQLSGGQRQAIAISRAIILDPPILVMDEPSSSMDNKTESDLIGKLTDILENKTLVLITHRTSMLKLVDRVIVVDNGIIVADGDKAHVMDALNAGKLSI